MNNFNFKSDIKLRMFIVLQIVSDRYSAILQIISNRFCHFINLIFTEIENNEVLPNLKVSW